MKILVRVLICLLLASCQSQREQKYAPDYAAWAGVDRNGAWTHSAEAAVAATSLPDQVPDDIQLFCPAYSQLNAETRVKFWTGLLSAIAKFESNFKPETKYIEKFNDGNGNSVVSRGLLQLSVESANQARYGCNVNDENDLHDPAVNLSCGARILAAWVEADRVVTSSSEQHAGGGNYWAVLRPSNGDLEKISAMTRGFGFCRV